MAYKGDKLADGTPLNQAVYRAFRNGGLSHNQALAITAEVGRENGFQAKYIFGGHIDPAGAKGGGTIQNTGFLSWNGNRGANLRNYLSQAGVWGRGGMARTQEALDAQARFAIQEMKGAYKGKLQQNRQLIESMPLLKDAEKGVEPDKMFSKHIIGGNIGQLRTTMDFLKAENPQLVADIKQSVLEHIAKNAINQSNGFSPAGMKKVLDSLGEPRLKSIFSDDELKRLKDLRMAGELLKQAPIGSNINHSNTASTLANIFGMMIDKVPFASIVKGVRDNINARSQLTGKITMPNVRTVYDDDTVHYATKAGFGLGVANADE
ncbi:MAG: hypothetical protein Q4D68_05635 [Moraxella equi]|nr:hypothetical protein [Moraxella equi]